MLLINYTSSTVADARRPAFRPPPTAPAGPGSIARVFVLRDIDQGHPEFTQNSVACRRGLARNTAPMAMTLTDDQKRQVAGWLNEGLKLSEVQKRIESDFGLRLTYMEVKFLIGDLDLTPKDIEPPRAVPAELKSSGPAGRAAPAAAGSPPLAGTKPAELPVTPTGVSLSVDQLARPGAVASGSVTFSDGKRATWYLDQLGRLGLLPAEKGYRPTAGDMQEFQLALEQELARQGY